VLTLSVPVALAELGWSSMNVVDTIMVGNLGASAIGAIAIGGSAFYSFAVFGMGLLLGLDTLVSQAYGAGDRDDCHRSLAQGVYIALLLTAPLMLFFALIPLAFRPAGLDESVSTLAAQFIRQLSYSTLPLLLYGAFRRYLQATGHVRPITFVLITANLVNWIFNWLLIEGHWGLPALGVVGSALSTVFARVYMAASLCFFIWWFERNLDPGPSDILRKFERARVALLLRIGFPAASQILLEISAFGAAAFLAGRLAPIALAAHQIAISVAALSYMIPLGISSAAAVMVGHAIGARKPLTARRRGYIAIGVGVVAALAAAALFLAYPAAILRIYTRDLAILDVGVKLLALAAAFQLFDSVQTVTTGALRGLGNTLPAMLINLAGYWLLGLPFGWLLCFRYGYGIYGIWWGLTLSLAAIATSLFFFWRRASAKTVASQSH
jgi:MATE family multidrug resistance protein